jgi:hypothetical protein
MNRFREIVDDEEVVDEKEREDTPDEVQKPATPGLIDWFSKGGFTKEAATAQLPFLMFLAFLVMIYIANSHMAVKNIRKIDGLSKEVKELGWEYKSLKADLMYKSKMTEVAKKVDTLGLKELIEPPQKIVVNAK